jgi:tetratricopeptide (TPR) repeat protein
MLNTQHACQPDPQKEGIPALAVYNSFGAMLFFLRENNGYSQQQIAEAIEPYLRSRKKATLDRRIVGSLEKNLRFPMFHELEPIYRAFVEHLEVAISDPERELYLQLAKIRIEEKQKRTEEISPETWEQLANTLASIQQKKRRLILLDSKSPRPNAEQPNEAITVSTVSTRRRLAALEEILCTDTSHLLERDAWIHEMCAYPEMTPAKKLVVNQGRMGAGKSHALAQLAQRLHEQEKKAYLLVPYRFSASESKTPDDQLEIFLSTLLSDLLLVSPDETKQTPLDQTIDQVFAALRDLSEAGKRVILLLDDAQALFSSPREWPTNWEAFAQRFVKEVHTATMFVFTRIWPGWPDRRRTYLVEKELPELSPQAGSIVWQRMGFDDVPPELLEQASIRCGGNPQLIEMRAFHQLGRSSASTFAWGKTPMLTGGHLSTQARPEKNANTRLLEELLAQDNLFDPKLDVKARQVLQNVITTQLSHPTVRVLECLALSPLGVPFTLLDAEFPEMALALDELVRASLLDLNMATAHRASVVPLVREAQLHMLIAANRKAGIEQRVNDLYAYWLMSLQDFRDDSEKAALVSEMIVRYMRQQQFLKAAELFIMYGWLCTVFGHIVRIQRVFEEAVKTERETPANVKHDFGLVILKHRIAVHTGQKVERDWRDQIYQDIYQQIIAGALKLEAHTELEVLHNMLLFYNRKGQLGEAKMMFEQAFERFQKFDQLTPEVSALFLFDRGRLMSYLAASDTHAKKQYTQESAACARESIANWRLCLKNALPLQESYIQFKLARTLNDLACDLRALQQYAEAQTTIEESIKLKKKSGTPSHSIAIALSECSQILAAQGKIREALLLNEEAKHLLEVPITNGDYTHEPELGLVLKECADILLLQSHLAEAQDLFKQAIELMGDKPLRQEDKQKAMTQIAELQPIIIAAHSYQLDRRWFTRFDDLTDYNDTKMLTQAGLFTKEEQKDWELLSLQDDEASQDQQFKLIARSRSRAAMQSREEQCEPTIQYPFFPLDNVQKRIRGLVTLRTEIEELETNAIVRRLYLAAVDDHLIFLRMCEAIVKQDQAAALKYNLQLYGKPSEREFKIALQQLCEMLLKARSHPLACIPAQEALAQLKSWGLSPEWLATENVFAPAFAPIAHPDKAFQASEKKMFSTATLRRFFIDVLAMYEKANWTVLVSPARDHTTIETTRRELILPDKSFSVQKVRQLLAEEIEVHSYRAIAGRNSPLALLGSGLANHLATDEGLAYHYVQSVNAQVYGKYEEKKWNATLTTGFASGVLTPPLSFPELRAFLEKMFVVSELLDGATLEKASEFALQAAWRRCSRVYRGAGCLSLKDRAYLQGHLEISDYRAGGGNLQRLYVGCVGVEHLNDMAELDILVPNHQHQQLALATDLADRLASYDI